MYSGGWLRRDIDGFLGRRLLRVAGRNMRVYRRYVGLRYVNVTLKGFCTHCVVSAFSKDTE